MKLFINQHGLTNHLLVMSVAFGFSTILFAALSVWLWGSTSVAKANMAKTLAAARKQGRKEQLKIDQAAALKEAQNPFRSYKAPEGIGRFELKFPKNWSAQLSEDMEKTEQLRLVAHPDFVRIGEEDKTAYALVVELHKRRSTDILEGYNDRVTEGNLRSSSVTVSGIASTRYEGEYEDDRKGAIVVIPLRDKTLTIATQDRQYFSQLAEVLSQSKL